MLEYLKVLTPIIVAVIALGQGVVNHNDSVENCLRINDLRRVARELILLSPDDPEIRDKQLALLKPEDC